MFFRKNKIATASLAGTRQLPWRGIIAVIIGLAVAAGSWWYLQQYVATHQRTEQIYVPSRDIPPYTVITLGDLSQRTIILGARETDAATGAGEIISKVAISTLYRGEQIRRERLVDPGGLERLSVTVSVDPVRVNGVNLGDLVDVYLIQSENTPGAILATDARVQAVKDAGGSSLNDSNAGALAAAAQTAVQQKTAAMVMLSVKPEEVPQVVRGAAAGSKGVVLVKKLKTGPVMAPVQEQPAAAVPGQQEQKPPH